MPSAPLTYISVCKCISIHSHMLMPYAIASLHFKEAAIEFLHPCNQKPSVHTSEEVETPDARLCESDVEDTASEEANTSSLCTRDCKLPSCMSEKYRAEVKMNNLLLSIVSSMQFSYNIQYHRQVIKHCHSV